MLKYVKCSNKVIYVCGDFNINLLNTDMHKDTHNFSEMMCAYGLFPLTDKPTRINIHSSTFIDNIFTNNISCDACSGILMNGIPDHLPIFTCCEQKLLQRRQSSLNLLGILKIKIYLLIKISTPFHKIGTSCTVVVM